MAENVKFDDNSTNYSTSNLRKVIDSQILPIIKAEIGVENIVGHFADLESVDKQHPYLIFGGYIRPITFDEARKYNDLLVNEELNDWWWTCTPWSTEDRGWKYSIAVVAPSGDFYGIDCNGSRGVRPFCIFKSNIFVS